MKTEIMAVVQGLQDRCFVNWRINTTFLALLPKVDNPVLVGDFCPMGLLHGVYKIVAKTLALRLDEVMDSLVSQHQGMEAKGRNILEPVLIANELIDLRVKSKSLGISCKIDLQKAFDCVSWRGLDYILDIWALV